MKMTLWTLSAYFILNLGGACILTQPTSANSLGNDLLKELNAMDSVYSAQYAPSAWKKSYANYDLTTQLEKAAQEIQNNPNLTLQKSREILKNFIYSMKDYHTSISFISTEKASLPFTVKGTDSKFFIMYINREKLPKSSFPFEVGDELITFDGKPTVQAISEVQSEIPANVPSTDRALAEMALTNRRSARGYKAPQGPLTLSIKSSSTNVTSSLQLIWDYTPEKIQPRSSFMDSNLNGNAENLFFRSEVKRSSLFHPQMNVSLEEHSAAQDPYALGSRKTFTPDLGIKIWQSADTDHFYAYIYKTEDRRLIGYLRLASYVEADFDKAVADFEKIITLFESTTDAMVIDQVNNPGGSVYYLYALASMLTKDPLRTPRHQMMITQGDVLESLSTISQLEGITSDEQAKKVLATKSEEGYPVSYEFSQFTLNYARFFVNEWNAGRMLTQPYWIGGVDHINPASSHYSKPILLLVNSLDFSGGDFFPATLQDNKRVTILGTRTAGAGGYVRDVQVPNTVGVDTFRCTASIAERLDHNPIENLGVQPDIEVQLTETDFTKNYADYVKTIREAVSRLIK